MKNKEVDELEKEFNKIDKDYEEELNKNGEAPIRMWTKWLNLKAQLDVHKAYQEKIKKLKEEMWKTPVIDKYQFENLIDKIIGDKLK